MIDNETTTNQISYTVDTDKFKSYEKMHTVHIHLVIIINLEH